MVSYAFSACCQPELTSAASGGFSKARVEGQGRTTTRDGILAAVPSALRCRCKEADKPKLAVFARADPASHFF